MTMQNPTGASKAYTEVELQEHIRKATATVQAENSALNRRLSEIGTSYDDATNTLSKVNAELDTLRKTSKLSEDAEGFVRYETETRARFAEERRQLDSDARNLKVSGLMREFPTLSEAELTGLKTPTEMEIYALRNHQKVDIPVPAIADASPPAPEFETEAVKPQLDRGGAGPATGAQSTGLRGTDKIAAGLANMHDPLGVFPK